MTPNSWIPQIFTRFEKVNHTISRKKCQQQTELYLLPYTEVTEKRETTGVHFPEEEKNGEKKFREISTAFWSSIHIPINEAHTMWRKV